MRHAKRTSSRTKTNKVVTQGLRETDQWKTKCKKIDSELKHLNRSVEQEVRKIKAHKKSIDALKRLMSRNNHSSRSKLSLRNRLQKKYQQCGSLHSKARRDISKITKSIQNIARQF